MKNEKTKNKSNTPLLQILKKVKRCEEKFENKKKC